MMYFNEQYVSLDCCYIVCIIINYSYDSFYESKYSNTLKLNGK